MAQNRAFFRTFGFITTSKLALINRFGLPKRLKDRKISINSKYLSTFADLNRNEMATNRAFEIAFVGLKPGVHEYDYEVDSKFFADKGVDDVVNVQAKVKLQLDKKSSFMLLKFDVGGTAVVDCDRCGNPIPKDIWDEFNMVVKLVENAEEMNNTEEDPDVFYLPRTESHLDVSAWIYEFVLLSIPSQKMCDNEGGPQCNKEVLDKLKQMEEGTTKSAESIWKGLEQFKKSN